MSQRGASGSTDFSDILQRSATLLPTMGALETAADLPRMERGVEQTALVSRRLAEKAARADGDSTKAHYLLATRGFDADRHTRTLAQIDLQSTIEPLEPIAKKDIQGYLRHQHRMLILAAIQEAKKNTISDFNQTFVNAMENDWDAEKKEIFEALGRRYDVETIVRAEDNALNNLPVHIVQRNRTLMNNKMLQYANVVYEMNTHRLQRQPFDASEAFAGVTAASEDLDHQTLAEILGCWLLVQKQTQEGDSSIVGENHFLDGYDKEDSATRRHLVESSLRFLQEQYTQFIRNTVDQRPSPATIHGRPDFLQFLIAFVDLQHIPTYPGEVVHGVHPWALMYYCLRCGRADLAAKVATDAKHIMGEDVKFVEMIATYVEHDGILPSHLRDALGMLLRHKRDDGFRQAVMNIVGLVDVNLISNEIFGTMEDFLWLRLKFIDDFQGQLGSGDNSLQRLQDWLVGPEVGPAHFVNASPLLYFRCLLLAAQFERAIDYLWASGKFGCEAVHFAIVLKYYGLLRLEHDPHSSLLTGGGDSLCRLNLTRLVVQYVRQFNRTDPRQALEYYFTFCSLANIEAEDEISRVFLHCVKDLVVESNEIGLILGSLNMDGTKKAGCIERYLPNRRSVDYLVELVAQSCESSGRLEDAVLLHDLAQNRSRMFQLINGQLGQVVPFTDAQSPNRAQICSLARKLATKYRGEVSLPREYNSFTTLLGLATFFDSYHSQHYEEALQELSGLGLLPTDNTQLSLRVDGFSRVLSDDIRRNIGSILLAAMTLLSELYKRNKRDETMKKQFRAQADAIVVFAGMISYRVSADVNSRLMQLNVLLSS